MYIRTITTDKEFDKVKNEWMNFEKIVDNKNITSSYLWQRTWWKHFGHIGNNQYGYDKKLSIIFLYNDNNKLRAIAPFCIVKRKLKKIFSYTIIEFIAQQWGATYLDFVTNKLIEEEYNFIFNWLKKYRKYDLIELKYIPQFTPNFDLDKDNIMVFSACPVIKIKNYKDVNQYKFMEYSKSLRKNLQTAKNRISREKINYSEEISAINKVNFKEIKSISRSKLKDNKHCVYNEVSKKNFLQNIYYNSELPCNIAKVILNNRLAAYRINFLYGQHKYCIDASYNRSFPHYDMGALSIDLNIGDSYEKNLSIHCMGTGIDFYKLKFTKDITKIYTFLKRGNTSKGVFLYFLKRKLNQKTAIAFEEKLGELRKKFKKH